jgi:hypothetical protein
MPVRYGISLSGLRLADSIHALSAHLQISDSAPNRTPACTFPLFRPDVRFTPESAHSAVQNECR